MKEKLYEKIKPLVDTFIEGLVKIETDSFIKKQGQQNNYENEVLKTQNERERLQERDRENNRILIDKTSALNNEKLKAQNLQIELQQIISDNRTKKNELDSLLRENKLLVESKKESLRLAEVDRDVLKDKIKHYENKIESLRVDEVKIGKEKSEIEQNRIKNNIKEKDNLKKEEELTKKEEGLLTRELDIKIIEKRITFAKKQLKLNE